MGRRPAAPPPPEDDRREHDREQRRRDRDMVDEGRRQNDTSQLRVKPRLGSGRKNEALAVSAYSSLVRFETASVRPCVSLPVSMKLTPSRIPCTVRVSSDGEP